MHTVVGTREFMPPEMFVEEGQSPSYKGSADIFSLGLVFLTLLQGRPFEGVLFKVFLVGKLCPASRGYTVTLSLCQAQTGER